MHTKLQIHTKLDLHKDIHTIRNTKLDTQKCTHYTKYIQFVTHN